MGVLGLTTFLEQYANTKYASTVCLTDCTVIVDGFNAAFFLYHHEKDPNSHVVGGDYANYGKRVREFFQHLMSANIFPIVLIDGAHEKEKFWTVQQRFDKTVAENIKPSKSGITVQPSSWFVPVGLKTAFVEILQEQNIFHAQTLLEADDAIAFLSEHLNAPVLSSDSDFQVYNGVPVAIPLSKIKFKSTGKNNEKVFALHAKFPSLKVVCKEVFQFDDDYLKLIPFLGVIFGNDKCSVDVFKDMFPTQRGTARFKHAIEWLKEQEPNGDNLIRTLMSECKKNLITEEVTHGLRHLKAPDYLPTLLNVYSFSGEEVNADTVHITQKLTTAFPALSTQTISYQNGKIIVERTKSLFNKSEIVDKLNEEGPSLSPLACELKLSKSNPEKKFPDWFMTSIRNCEISSEVLDLMANHKIWLWPQAEMPMMVSSQDISIPILVIIAGVLGCDGPIEVYSGRGNSASTSVIDLAPALTRFDFSIPILYHEDLLNSRGHMLFLATFGCLYHQDFINQWPSNCRFAIITLLFFLNQKIKNCSAIGVGILLSILKANIVSNNDQADSTEDNKISAILKTQKMTKKVKCLYKMVENTSKLGSYELERVYSFCEYKSIFAHGKVLNTLLGKPYRVPKLTSLNSFIVYHVFEATTTRFLGHCPAFVEHWLGKEPLGKVLLSFLKFAESPVDDKPIKKNQSSQNAQNGQSTSASALADQLQELEI